MSEEITDPQDTGEDTTAESLADMSDDQLMELLADSGDDSGSAPDGDADVDGEDDHDEEALADDGDNDAEVAEPDTDADTDDDAGEPRVLSVDEALAEFDGLRVDTGDGSHELSALITRHRDVQIAKQRAAEAEKSAEQLKDRAGIADAIDMRLQADPAGLGLDAISGAYPGAVADIVSVLQKHGYTPDAGRASLAEAKLKAQQDVKTPKRSDSDVIQIRKEAEVGIGMEFNDAQWNAIYSQAEALEAAGDGDIVHGVVTAVAELFPDVLKRVQDAGKSKTGDAPKKTPKRSVRPGASKAPSGRLADMSDDDLKRLWASVEP